MLKHGIYMASKQEEDVYELYWMGERVSDADFNERLRNQAKSVAKDVDMIQVGMDLHEMIDKGEKADDDLTLLQKALKEILELPICPDCKERIEVWGTQR